MIILALSLAVLLAFALVVVVAIEPGVPPGDVALAYELAWDRLDFEAVWSLSGSELRDGLDRAAFVTAKRAVYADRPELGGLARQMKIDELRVGNDIAVARTHIEGRDSGVTANEIDLVKRSSRWVVVGYQLQPEAPPVSQ